MKINILLLFVVLLFHALYINISYINSYSLFSYVLLILCTCYTLLSMPKIDKKYKKNNRYLFILLLVMGISAILNQSMDSIILIIKIFNIFIMAELIVTKEYSKQAINLIFYLLAFYIMLNDISMFIFGPLSKSGYNVYYMLGNKFTIGLLHIELILVYLAKKSYKRNNNRVELKKLFIMILFLLSIFISIKVQCSTTVVCNIILIILLAINKKVKLKLFNPKIILLVLLISSFILILYSNVLEINFVKYIIVNLLGEDVTLTGRMEIYDILWPIIKNRLLFGYGQGSSNTILMEIMNAPNTQNGLIEFTFSFGIIASMLFLIFIYFLLKSVKPSLKSYPFLCYIYLCFIISCVEISIGIKIFIFLAFVIMLDDKSKEKTLGTQDHNQKI